MERFNYHGRERNQGAVGAKASERVSLPVVWGKVARRISLFQEARSCVLCGYFKHQRRVHFEGCVAGPLQTITAVLPGSKWSCLLLRSALQDALSEVTKVCPLLNLRVFVDDITGFMNGGNKDLVEMAQKVFGEVENVEEKGLKLSITEEGKEGKSKAITCCNYLDKKFQEHSKKEGVALETNVETLTVAFGTRRAAGGEGEGEKKKV